MESEILNETAQKFLKVFRLNILFPSSGIFSNTYSKIFLKESKILVEIKNFRFSMLRKFFKYTF